MKRLIGVFLLMCNFQFAYAESASESLIVQLTHIKTFSSKFDQQVLDEHGRVLQHSSGEMQFSKNPALFYWNVLSPEHQEMWYRDNQFIVFDPELAQATIKKITSKQDPSLLPVMLLTGNAVDALKNFSVDWMRHKYILTPKKNDDGLLVRVVVELDDKGAVHEIQYQTSLGQMTKIIFSGAQVNKSLNQALFHQVFSKDVDVVLE